LVVFDLQGVSFIDSQGAGKLREIADALHAKGLSFRLARVKPGVMDVLERDGLVERIGAANFHLDVHEAVMAHMEQLQPEPG
jgi:SulP family sulfate permease